jgi:KUP system potassium uptake protein
MSAAAGRVPPALLHNLEHNKVLHSRTAVLTVVTEDVPRIDREAKVRVDGLGQGFLTIAARFGFMEEPSVPCILALPRERGLDFELAQTSFFLGRERILSDRRPRMPIWREKIFAFMSRNALGATACFHIPPERVVALGIQVEL